MESRDIANPSLTDLMAAVGYFLLRWGWLESLLASRPVPKELEHARKMRNTICHGMRSAFANTSEDASTAFIECCSVSDGSLVRYSYEELQAAIRCLERAPRLVNAQDTTEA